MARGKRGPRPQVKESDNPPVVCAAHDIPIDELEGCPLCRDEQEAFEEVRTEENTEPLITLVPSDYRCLEKGCQFLGSFEEWTEHSLSMDHTSFITEERKEAPAEQAELFAPPAGPLKREIAVPISEGFLNETKSKLATLYQEHLDIKARKKAADDACNEELKFIDEEMRSLAKILKDPTEKQWVDCEWRVIDEENARGLFRLDTGECLETKPLTMEDRARELVETETVNG